jgi:hypothetical protein
MAINIPLIKHPVAQTFLKILNLEATQRSLPDSRETMNVALGVYAFLQFTAQLFAHSFIGSVIYGGLSAAICYFWNLFLLRHLNHEDKFVRTVIAVAGMGAIGAFAYIVLHALFGIALPPPLPTERLLRFLLFPIIVWLAFIYAFFYRHVDLRPVPAFFVAALYVLIIEVILSAVAR